MLPATRAGCIGPVRQVRKQLERLSDLGVELVLCKLIPTLENVDQIGKAPIERPSRNMPLHLAS